MGKGRQKVVQVILIVFVALSLTGCATLGLGGNGREVESSQNKARLEHEKESVIPKLLGEKVANETHKERTYSYDEGKDTYEKRQGKPWWAWLPHAAAGLFGLILLWKFFAPPLLKGIASQSLEAVHGVTTEVAIPALKETTKGIREFLKSKDVPEDVKEMLRAKLSDEQAPKSKAAVETLKRL